MGVAAQVACERECREKTTRTGMKKGTPWGASLLAGAVLNQNATFTPAPKADSELCVASEAEVVLL